MMGWIGACMVMLACALVTASALPDYYQQYGNEVPRPSKRSFHHNCPPGHRRSDAFNMSYFLDSSKTHCVDCGKTCCRVRADDKRQTEEAIDKRVRHSQEAGDGFFPWSVAIFRRNGTRWEFICGGVLIGDKAIATAAHCVTANDITSHRLRVTVGEVDIRIDSNGRRLNKRGLLRLDPGDFEILNRDESGSDRATGINVRRNDLAILKLTKKIDKPRICLRTRTTRPTSPVCFGIGHGRFEPGNRGPRFSSRLRVTSVTLDFDNEHLRRKMPERQESLLCAETRGTTTSCNFDSGSPVVCRLHSENKCSSLYLAGIFSFHDSPYGAEKCSGRYSVLANMYNRKVGTAIVTTAARHAKLQQVQADWNADETCTSMLTEY